MNPPDGPHRFLHFSTTLDAAGARCELEGEEHHHATHVLRLRVGDETYATNGRGAIAKCVVESIAGDRTVLSILDRLAGEFSAPQITLALATVRKDAFELAVRQCTELGVTRFVPFSAEKCHIHDYSRSFRTRLGKIALAAMKQSFRGVLPEIEEVRTLPDLAAEVERHDHSVVGDPEAPPLAAAAAARVLVVVGPEAGLSTAEMAQLRGAGYAFASAGPGRLRAETAAAALVAFVGSQFRAV